MLPWPSHQLSVHPHRIIPKALSIRGGSSSSHQAVRTTASVDAAELTKLRCQTGAAMLPMAL
jgi:hypothetical protein